MTDEVISWNNVLLNAIRTVGGAPTPIARVSAMMHAAIYDAVNSIQKTYQPYLLSLPTPSETSAEAAVIHAAHRVLSVVFPSLTSDMSLREMLKNTFNEALSTSLSKISTTDMEASENGRILGQAIANAIIANRADDGSDNNDPYVSGSNPGDWRPTGSGDAVTPNWPSVRPFTMTSGSQFRPPRPAGYATKFQMLSSPEYAAQVNEVKQLGSATSTARTAEQTEIAFFWANDLDGTYKPPGQLFRLTQIVSKLRQLSLEENARLFALVGLALGDAAIAAWDAKYSTDLDLWRPETAIRLANTDGNRATQADPNWEPLSVMMKADGSKVRFSPAFPAYVSGHATFGATHSGILRNYFGTDNVTFTLDTDDPSVPGVTRTFNSFSSAALENGRSRVYLGVHYQWDADAAYVSGTQLADYVFANFLRPLTN
jgi:membrane-associated phospholipid phosphatase